MGEFDDRALAETLGIERKVVTDYRRSLNVLPLKKTDAGQAPPPFTGQLPIPRGAHRLGRQDYMVAAASSIIVLFVYIATLPPTVSGEDSGELITAAYTLGIPHPPGYPAWCLLAHPFTYLPFGTVAWRVAFSSAVFGAGAAFFAGLITIKLSGSRIAGCAAALLFAFSKDVWEQSVIAEVYALNALFIAACVFLLVEWYGTRRNFPLLLFAFLYGLSLANHSTTRLLGPAFLLFVLFIDPVPWKRWKLYGACIGLSLVGISAFAYLPIRSMANPPMDWGNPETWTNFWAVVRQEQFAFLLTQHERSLGLFMQQVQMFLKYYWDAFTPLLAFVPLLGLYPFVKGRRPDFTLVAGLAVLLSLGMVLALNYGTDTIAVVVNNVFFIPFHMMAAILAGLGLNWLMEQRVRTVSLRPLAIIAASACAVIPALWHYRANDKSGYYFAYDFGRNILDTLEPNAIYLPAADHATFPVIYLQTIDGLRPDVTIGNKYGYIEESLYADMPEEARNSFRRIPTEPEQRFIEEWIIAHTDRPVYMTEKRSFPKESGLRLENAGLTYRVVRKDEAWAPRDFWAEYSWHTLDPVTARGEFTAEAVLVDYHFARGRDYLAQDNAPRAIEAFEQMVAIARNAPEALNNAATALAESGRLDEAAGLYLRSIEADTNYTTGLRNLGQVYMALQKNEAALLVLGRLKSLEPRDVQAQFLYVGCLKALGRYEEARDELQAMATARPNDARVHRELGLLYTEQLRDPVRGREHITVSLKLDPNQEDLQQMLANPTSTMPQLPGLPNLEELTNPLSRTQGLSTR